MVFEHAFRFVVTFFWIDAKHKDCEPEGYFMACLTLGRDLSIISSTIIFTRLLYHLKSSIHWEL